MTEHLSHCDRWEWIGGSRALGVSKPCNCGYAEYQEKQHQQARTSNRPLRPLGMSEDDFLRSMGIEPL